MIDATKAIEGYEFPQKAEMFALVKLDNKLFAVPTVTLGQFTVIFTTEAYNNRKPEIIAFTVRECVTGNFNILPGSEEAYNAAMNYNIANAFIGFVCNLFVSEQIRLTLSLSENSNRKGMVQQFIDFIAALANVSYSSGVNVALVSEEVRYLVGSIVMQVGASEVLYEIAPYLTEGTKRFTDVYLKADDSMMGKFDLPLADEDLDFLSAL